MVINITTYFEKLWFKEKGEKLDVRFLRLAIAAGKEDFWAAYQWAFKEKPDTVTTTSAQETVELPDDFGALLDVRERTSTPAGLKLTKLTASKYDRLVPYSANLPNYIPHSYKVSYDREDSIWKLYLYPTPSAAITLYVNYHVLEDGGEIPQKYIAALIAAATKYLFLVGSRQHSSAANTFDIEIERLKRTDNVDIEEPGKMLDSSDSPNFGTDFSEYMRVGLWL